MPMGQYKDFDHCIRENQDKEDPNAYCATIMRAVEKTKDTEWMDTEEWYNKRIIETVISAPIKDDHGDKITLEAIAQILPWYKKYGYYEWMHTGLPIGKVIGWRIKNGKPMIRVGIHDTKSSHIDAHDKAWEIIKEYGLRGTSSIKGVANIQRFIRDGFTTAKEASDVGLWGVGWVADQPANPEAVVTYVNQFAKSKYTEPTRMRDTISQELFDKPFDELTDEEKNRVHSVAIKLKKSLADDTLALIKMNELVNKEASIVDQGHTAPPRADGKETKEKLMTEKKEKQEEEASPDEGGAERDFAAELDAIKTQLAELADAVTKLAPGTQDAAEEAAARAEEVKEEVEESAETEEPSEVEMMKAEITKMEKKFNDRLDLLIKGLETITGKPLLEKRSTTPTPPKPKFDIANIEADMAADPRKALRGLGLIQG